jgi:hypothetical protein
MNYSPYQRDVFDYMAAGSGNRIVKAVAGSGKATTIVHGLAGVRDCNALVLAPHDRQWCGAGRERKAGRRGRAAEAAA